MNGAWRDRTPRERMAIGLAGGVLVLALVAAFVWLPLERARTRLHQQLPQMRASLAALERQADEARRLRSMPPIAAAAKPEPLASVVTAGGGKQLPGAQLSIPDGKTLVVQAGDVGFGALVDWLAMVQASQGLRVREARLEALPTAGHVRGELRLARP